MPGRDRTPAWRRRQPRRPTPPGGFGRFSETAERLARRTRSVDIAWWRAGVRPRSQRAMSSFLYDGLTVMVREFDARLQKGDAPGAWTCVVMDDAAELFGTRGLVKVRGSIDGEPFDGALMAQGDGTHRLPVKARLRKALRKEAGDTVHVRIDERIG